MPITPEHLAKAEWNEKFAETVSKTKFLDWAVTITFYAALHYVDAVLSASGVHPESHTDRGDAMGINDTLMRIRKEYRTLETLSRNARYRAMKIDEGDLHQAQQAFTTLRSHLRKRMGLEAE